MERKATRELLFILIVACLLGGVGFYSVAWLTRPKTELSVANSAAHDSSESAERYGSSRTVGARANTEPQTGRSLDPTTSDSQARDEFVGTEVEPIRYAIAGQVTDADGRPIEGANVEVLPFQPTLFSHQAIEYLASLSAPELVFASEETGRLGLFELELPGPGRYVLRVVAVGYEGAVEGPIRVHPKRPEASVAIPLTAGFQIDGWVEDSSGRRLEGIAVNIRSRKRGDGLNRFTRQVKTDAGGRFVFRGLGAVDYTLLVPPDQAETDTVGCLVPSVIAPTSDVLIKLPIGESYSGRVLDNEGRPIRGARITALNPVSFDQALTREDGRFNLRLNGPDADIVIESSSYLLLEERIYLNRPGTHEFVLRRGDQLEGQLRFPNGEPAVEVEVALLQATQFLGRLQTARTDASGKFVFGGVEPSQPFFLLPRLRDYWLPFDRAIRRADAYTLAPTLSLRGRVIDTNGRPVRNAWVHLKSADPADLSARALNWLRGEAETWTQPDGAFVLEDQLPGVEYEVVVIHDDSAETSRKVIVGAEPPEIVLSPGGGLDVRLTTTDGRVPVDAYAILTWPGGPQVRQRQNGELEGGVRYFAGRTGIIQIDRLPARTLRLTIVAEGYVTERLDLTIEEGVLLERAVTLVPGCELRVRVTGDAGEPLPMAQVTVSSTSSPSGSARRVIRRRTGSDGICQFASLEPGRYRVQASYSSRRISESLSAPDPDQYELELRFPSLRVAPQTK